MSKLEEILQAEAQEEIDGILDVAADQAQKIVSEAKSDAESQVLLQQKKLEAEERTALQKARSLADHSRSIARIQARGEMMEQVRQRVQEALEEAASQSGYSGVLQALAEEALGIAGKAEAVMVHPGDVEKLQDWAQQRELKVRTSPELRLGVRIVSADGAAVENTLLGRLRLVWPALGPELTARLWERGGEGD
jgi:vacuolar-type H+-ATPase subunit E/Vma4